MGIFDSKDAIAVLDRLDVAAGLMASHSANIAELATGLKLNGVVYSGTVQLGSDGRKLVHAHSNFASATVRAAGADVTVTTQGDSGNAPTSGPGVFLVPGGVDRTIAVAGNVLVLYGTAGAKVAVTLWVQPQSPSSASAHPMAVDVVPAGIVNVPAAIASTVLAAANPNRRGLSIYNDSTATLWIAHAPAASTVLYTVQLPAQDLYELPGAPFYRGAVSGIWAAAAGAALVTEHQ